MGERPIGVLTFRARRSFTPRDQDLAEAFAGQAAIALEHSRLYREARRQAERMRALSDLARAVSETLDPEAVGLVEIGAIFSTRSKRPVSSFTRRGTFQNSSGTRLMLKSPKKNSSWNPAAWTRLFGCISTKSCSWAIPRTT